MAILSQETGLGRSSLYHHFPAGKEAMALEALDRVEALLRGPMTAALDRGDALATDGGSLQRLLHDYYEGGELGCLLGAFAAGDSTPAVAVRVGALTNLWIDLFASFAREAGVREPVAAAAQAIMTLQGGLMISAATGNRAHFALAVDAMVKLLRK